MIGGEDILVGGAGLDRAASLDSVVRIIFKYWRGAIFQDGTDGKQYALFSQIPFGRVQELLIYRDRESLRSWENLGADPSNAGTMVHVVASQEGITLVVDDARSQMMRTVIEEVRRVLSMGFPWKVAA